MGLHYLGIVLLQPKHGTHFDKASSEMVEDQGRNSSRSAVPEYEKHSLRVQPRTQLMGF